MQNVGCLRSVVTEIYVMKVQSKMAAIVLYRDAGIAAIASSRKSLTTLSGGNV